MVAAFNVERVVAANQHSAGAGRTVVDFQGGSCVFSNTQVCLVSFLLETTCLVCEILSARARESMIQIYSRDLIFTRYVLEDNRCRVPTHAVRCQKQCT